tara:strand:- start:317902 stop:318219 length:318 start_codon:yes stop_codon:yes gene_type:complete
MKEQYIKIPLENDETKKRFQIEVAGSVAFVDYRVVGDQIALIHTEVDPELSGQGAASALVEKILNHIESSGKLILPYCPYVFAYIKKHPEWKRMVAKNFNGYDKL